MGARFGPSLMPGGHPASWEHLRPIWEAIAAKVDRKTGKPREDWAPGRPVTGGEPCTAYIGPNGAGHYVKMVHNGIEYIDMQLISEAYHLLHRARRHDARPALRELRRVEQTELGSYLIEITAEILKQRDPARPTRFSVDAVLDAAGQKGTGKWTSVNALDMGIPANAIAEAVFARCLSALKEERVAAAKVLKGPSTPYRGSKPKLVEAVRRALYCSKICAYAQGFQLMAAAQKEYDWALDSGTIAAIWRGGCIIRARFLQKITEAYRRDPDLVNLMLAPYFKKALAARQESWREVVALAVRHGIPVPAFGSAALSDFDGDRSARLPANPPPGPARPLRRAHLRTRGRAARGVLPRGLARPKRPQRPV